MPRGSKVGLLRVPRVAVADRESVWPTIRALAPAALVIDVEPFVAAWRTDEATLARGLREQLAACEGLQGLHAVWFVTNSHREPREGLASEALSVGYISRARKPFLDLRRLHLSSDPVVVLGDQVLTDGLTAWRLGATFLQIPLTEGASAGATAQALLGRLVGWLFFRR